MIHFSPERFFCLLKKAWTIRLIRYIIVGAWNSVFGLALLFWMKIYIFKNTNLFLVFTCSSLISTSQSFMTHRFFIWKSNAALRREVIRFFVVSVSTFLINLLLLLLLVDVLHLPLIACQLCLTLSIALFVYLMLGSWVFRVS